MQLDLLAPAARTSLLGVVAAVLPYYAEATQVRQPVWGCILDLHSTWRRPFRAEILHTRKPALDS